MFVQFGRRQYSTSGTTIPLTEALACLDKRAVGDAAICQIRQCQIQFGDQLAH